MSLGSEPACPGCNRARLVLLAAAACLGFGAFCGVSRTGVPLHSIGSRYLLRCTRAAASSAEIQGEGSLRDHSSENELAPENFAAPHTSAAAADDDDDEPLSGRPRLAGGGHGSGGLPLFADLLELGTDTSKAAAGGDAGSRQIPPPLLDGRHYHQDQTMRPGSSATVTSGVGDVAARVGADGGSGRGSRRGPWGGEMYPTEKRGVGDDSGGAHEHDGEANALPRRSLSSVEDDGGNGDETCRPLKVEGLDNCPELMLGGGVPSNATVESLLATKAEILRQVIDVLADPASAGEGGNPDEPLLLVRKLALDEADVEFGAFDTAFLNHDVPDAAAWSPLPGGFDRWLRTYHRKVLRGTRPVLINVHGNDVCALEQELLSPDIASSTPHLELEEGLQDPRQGQGRGESSVVPVVLMTLGWDPSGDPTHRQDDEGRDRSCVFRVLAMERVIKWFTSHTRNDSHTDAKFRYLPIGFGGYETRNGLPHTAYIEAARRQLKILETCPVENAGSYDLLFQCNSLERHPREAIWKEMTEGKGLGTPIPVNRAPLEPGGMVEAAARGIFGVSPPGTGPDCFRHYEMILEGNIALVPDVYSVRQIMKGLPVFFFGGREEAWGSLSCGRLLEMAEEVRAKIKEGAREGGTGGGGGGLQLEKLTHGFWRRFIRREVLLAGGADENAEYVERSPIPLNPHGWTTFRRVGCFARGDEGYEEGGEKEKGVEEGEHHHNARRPRKPFLKSKSFTAYSRASGRTTTAAGGEGADESEVEPSPDSHDRRLRLAGREPVRLESPGRTPESCASHCSTKIGGGIGFFGIGSGHECWCDKIPGRFVPEEQCNIGCDGDEGGGGCGGEHASTAYVFGPEDGPAPFEYMGCFPPTKYLMFHAAVHLGNASTPPMCAAFCTSLRLPFFALERSELCRCGVVPANSPHSDKAPAHIEGGGYEPVPGPPNGTRAAKPVPEGVRVGDPRFECHLGRCKGDSSLMGCGSERAYDLYRNTDPCMLYRDC